MCSIHINILIEVNDDLISPKPTREKAGSSIMFHCENAMNVYWFFEKKDHYPKSGQIEEGDSYFIPSLTSHHSGYYFCFGKYSNRIEHFIAKTQITVTSQTFSTDSLGDSYNDIPSDTESDDNIFKRLLERTAKS